MRTAVLSLVLTALLSALPVFVFAESKDAPVPIPFPNLKHDVPDSGGKVKIAPKDPVIKDKSHIPRSSGEEAGTMKEKPAGADEQNLSPAVTGKSASAGSKSKRTATLVVERDETCNHAGFVDHMVSTDSVTFMLPESDGPVSAGGSYRLKGSGYSLAGPSAYRGRVVEDRELVLTYGQWWHQGKALTPAAPEMPTAGQPVSMPLEPGSVKKVSFKNAHADIAPCSGTVIYRLKMKRETQIWDVFLKGSSQAEHRLQYWVTDDGDGKSGDLNYVHGVLFSFDMAARVTLTRRKGSFEYSSGKITRAKVDYEYKQQPEAYQVENISCKGCDAVAKLAEGPLPGVLKGEAIRLLWPEITPVVEMKSRFKLQCAQGKHQSTCENNKKTGSNFGVREEEFLGRAAGHSLPLVPGPLSFASDEKNKKGASVLYLRHDYELVRVK